MRQRAMIAMAPDLPAEVADRRRKPTTVLDVTVQAQTLSS
jgi:ABC-type dipeptide/oligopeptide/nickel transport system ATPase component